MQKRSIKKDSSQFLDCSGELMIGYLIQKIVNNLGKKKEKDKMALVILGWVMLQAIKEVSFHWLKTEKNNNKKV